MFHLVDNIFIVSDPVITLAYERYRRLPSFMAMTVVKSLNDTSSLFFVINDPPIR